MADIQKVITGWERCIKCRKQPVLTSQAYADCEYTVGLYCGQDRLVNETIEVLKECQKKIEDLEERIAIMSEGDDTGEELPFLYDDTPDEPCEEDEYV